MSDSILLHRDGRVVDLTLNRPPLNILDIDAITALRQHLEELSDERELQLLVLRGSGEKAFSAGVAVEDHTPDKVPVMLAEFHAAILALRHLPAITIAAVRGHCLGGGMELAAGCDIVLASNGSRFGQPEIKLGCYPPLAAALYPTLLGSARTFDLLITGRSLDCEEAENIGFVTRRVEDAEFESELEALQNAVTDQSLAVSRLAKRAIRAGIERPFSEALAESERLYLEELAATLDMQEGLAAFLEKRGPNWKHR